MSITVKFSSKPTPEELEIFKQKVDKFSKISFGTMSMAEDEITKIKDYIDVVACKFCAQHRHTEIMKLIRKKEKEIKKRKQ